MPYNMMQMTMPALHMDKSALWSKVVYQSPAQLNTFRAWSNIDFKGQGLSDFFSAATTESTIRKIIADTSHIGGVRIRFLPGATYANLVKVLDSMNYTNQKKYWLDIHHYPTTLYAITLGQENAKKNVSPAYLGCCTCGPYLLQSAVKAAWWLEFQNLWLNNWQPATLLLSLIGILSLWRLIQYKPGHYNS